MHIVDFEQDLFCDSQGAYQAESLQFEKDACEFAGEGSPAVTVFDSEFPSTLAIIASLGRRGVPIQTCGPSAFPLGRASPYCNQYLRSPPPTEIEAFSQWLRQRLESGEINRVAPTSDLIAFHCARLREWFPEPVRRTVATVTELEDCLIKPRFHAACEAIGQPTPRTWLPRSLEEAAALAPDLPYPVMIKPRSHLGVGLYYRGALANSAAEFLDAYRMLPPFTGQDLLMADYPDLRWPMVQRFEPSARQRVYSLCGLRDECAGVVAASAVCKTDQWPPGIGIGTRFEAVEDSKVMAAGLRVAERFVRHGFFQIEFIVRDGELLAIDFNPRAYAMLSFDIARGNDLPWLWYLTTVGEEMAVLGPPRGGLYWHNDVPFHIGHWVRTLRGPRRVQRLKHYLKQLREPSVSATAASPWWLRMMFVGTMLRHPGSLVRPYWNERD